MEDDQENIKRLMRDVDPEWSEIYRQMAEGSAENNPEKLEPKKDVAQVLHHLQESLDEDRKSLNHLQNVESGVGTEITASRDKDIFKGRIEALEYAINQVKSTYKQPNEMSDYLLTGKRGKPSAFK